MEKHLIRRVFAVIAAAAPLILIVYVLQQHGMIDYIESYTPLQRNFEYLATADILLVAALIFDFAWRNKHGRAARVLSRFMWVMSAVSILMTAGFGAYIFLPRMPGAVQMPPRLIIVDPPAGQKTPGLAVMFYTAPVSKNTILWGEVGGKLKSITEKAKTNQHSIRLDGLKPGRDYMYSVNDESPVIFRTPPQAGQPIWFAAAGDAHVGNETSRPDLTDKMLTEIAKPTNGYAMFFDLGDTAQLGFSRKTWAQVGQEFGPYIRSIPTAFLPGNHDMMFGGDALYERYMGRIEANGNASPLWQRIDVGDVHFILLDLEWELQTYTPAEQAWLESQLKSIPKNDWTIVMCHTFFYASGGQQDGWNWYDNTAVINKLAPLFEEYDVDLVMSGHKHQAEFLEKNGVAYVVAGTFGGNPDPVFDYKSPASKWLKNGAYCFADVTIAGGTATITFRDPDYQPLYTTKIKR